jgi:Fe-Mn family superoxide dismutase
LTPEKNTKPSPELEKAINEAFGSMDVLKEKLNAAAATRFGSGWAWLYVDSDKKIAISSTPNQDNPLMNIAESKGTPVLGIDVWEHAYYLKYQNKRTDYLAAIWNIINWNEVSKNYKAAIKGTFED